MYHLANSWTNSNIFVTYELNFLKLIFNTSSFKIFCIGGRVFTPNDYTMRVSVGPF